MMTKALRATAALLAMTAAGGAQVYSPQVLRQGQPDASDPARLAQSIYAEAHAATPRQRAEAIWRFFLTDGRFVAPGFWYHIAGWAYEEPGGEVLDPVKLLNSYGFGLCYQIAPVLEAVWKAGGFEDARVWFLTGHTVAEVFYDGGYHHFDSDMMGYNTVAGGHVASVHEIENDGAIILAPQHPVTPWYPADVRAGAIPGLAGLFTTRRDNSLFPFERAPRGHQMDFVLRPGERLVRYFRPQREGLFYLPYKDTGGGWQEFPRELAEYNIRTENGPHSQKDARRWATGRIEYRPEPARSAAPQVIEVRSPYVIIGADFDLDAELARPADSVIVETSGDEGRTWRAAAVLHGPHSGRWHAAPAVLTRSEHGSRTAVSGKYAYLVRLTRTAGARIAGLSIQTYFQLNPRTLPPLTGGHNAIEYSAGAAVRREYAPVEPVRSSNVRYVATAGQGFWTAAGSGFAEIIFRVPGTSPADTLEAGARFLDLGRGLAPNKFTAEVRHVAVVPASAPAASIAWGAAPGGPFKTVWEYDPRPRWRDGIPIDRRLLWPEVDRRTSVAGARDLYVRYRFRDLAADSFRLATETAAPVAPSPLTITHVWVEDGVHRTAMHRVAAGAKSENYTVEIPPGARVENEAVILECPRPGK